MYVFPITLANVEYFLTFHHYPNRVIVSSKDFAALCHLKTFAEHYDATHIWFFGTKFQRAGTGENIELDWSEKDLVE